MQPYMSVNHSVFLTGTEVKKEKEKVLQSWVEAEDVAGM